MNYLIFLVFFIIYFLISFIASKCGWNRLAKCYKKKNSPFISRSFQSCSIGRSNFRFCINFGIHDEGLTISVFTVFKFLYPNLFIPFRDIKIDKERILFSDYYVFTFAKTPDIVLIISDNLAQFISKNSDLHLPNN